MDKNKLNISEIENFFYNLLSGTVSNQVFRGSYPTAINSAWNDMVIIDCASMIKDYDSNGFGIVSILLYPAKNLGNGTKNVTVLAELETKLNQAIASNTSTTYKTNRAGVMTEYDTTRKLYYNVVFINTKIY